MVTTEPIRSSSLKTVAAAVVPQGGEGKTFLTQCIHCVADFAGITSALGTNDGTNRALAALMGSDNVASLSWDADAERGRTVVMRQRSMDLVCIDVGANSDPTDARFLDFAHGAREAAAKIGARFVVLIPSATNKGGGLVSAVNASTTYAGEGFETRLILNDRDGSGNYGDPSIIPDEISVGRLGHLATGLMAYRMTRRDSLYKLITEPTAGYEDASARIRNFVLRVAKANWMSDIFWWDGALRELPRPGRDPKLGKVVLTLDQAGNAALQLNAAYAEAYDAFASAEVGSKEFEDVALRLHSTMQKYR